MSNAKASPVVGERRVTALELFFDLVFVFALTQVTTLMADDPSWLGLLRGMAVLTVLWWAWVAYVWIGTTTDAEDGVARFVLLVAMAAMFVTALAAPHAFDRYGVSWATCCSGVATCGRGTSSGQSRWRCSSCWSPSASSPRRGRAWCCSRACWSRW